MLINISEFWAGQHESLLELEINPIAVMPDGKGVCALDAIMKFVAE